MGKGQASRENGKKGGRPKGSLGPEQLDKIAMRELVRQRVGERLDEPVRARREGQRPVRNHRPDAVEGERRHGIDSALHGRRAVLKGESRLATVHSRRVLLNYRSPTMV